MHYKWRRMKCVFKGKTRSNKVINEITSCIFIAMRNLSGEKWYNENEANNTPLSLRKEELMSTTEVTPLM